MRLATEPHSEQPALEHALEALAQLVRARKDARRRRPESDFDDVELLDLAQAALWGAVDRALRQEPGVSALFPSLQRLPEARREELRSDVHGVQRALEHWRSEPRAGVEPEARTRSVHDDEMGLLLTTAAHAEGFHALAAWVCGADALEELELVLSGLLAQVGVLALEPMSTSQRDVFVALLAHSRAQWSGPAPRRSPLPAPIAPSNTEPGSPSAKASRAANGTAIKAEEPTANAPERERRLLLGASLAALLLLTLGVLSWARSGREAEAPPSMSPPQSLASQRGDTQRVYDPHQSVRIYSRPTRAELYLDGRFIGLTPLELARSEAAGLLRLSLHGYPPLEEQIDLRRSANSVLVFELGHAQH